MTPRGDEVDVRGPEPGCRLSTVIVARPRCPRCSSPKLRAVRSSEGGDGSLTRYTVCQCGHRFKLLLE